MTHEEFSGAILSQESMKWVYKNKMPKKESKIVKDKGLDQLARLSHRRAKAETGPWWSLPAFAGHHTWKNRSDKGLGHEWILYRKTDLRKQRRVHDTVARPKSSLNECNRIIPNGSTRVVGISHIVLNFFSLINLPRNRATGFINLNPALYSSWTL